MDDRVFFEVGTMKPGDVLVIKTNSFFMVPSTGEVKCLEGHIVMCTDVHSNDITCNVYHPEHGTIKIALRYLSEL